MSGNTDSVPQLSGVRMLMRALDNRFKLAGIELEESRAKLLLVGALAALVVGLILLMCVAGFVVLVALTWDTAWRVAAPALAGVLLGLGAMIATLIFRRRLNEWRPFEATAGQLSRDAKSIRSIMRDSEIKEEGAAHES